MSPHIETVKDEWYLALDEVLSEPMNLEALCLRLSEMAGQEELYVWREGMDDWAPPEEVPELQVVTGSDLFNKQEHEALEKDLGEILAHEGAIWAGSGLSPEERRALSKPPPGASRTAEQAPAPAPPSPTRPAMIHAPRAGASPEPPPVPGKKRTWPRVLLAGLLLVEVAVVGVIVIQISDNAPETDRAPEAEEKTPAPALVQMERQPARTRPRPRTVRPSPVMAPRSSPPPRAKAPTPPRATPVAETRQERIRSLLALINKRDRERKRLIADLGSGTAEKPKAEVTRIMQHIRKLNELNTASHRRIVRLKRGQE